MSYISELVATTIEDRELAFSSSDSRKIEVLYSCPTTIPFLWISLFQETDYYLGGTELIPFCKISDGIQNLNNAAKYLESLFVSNSGLNYIIGDFITSLEQHRNKWIYLFDGTQHLPKYRHSVLPELSSKITNRYIDTNTELCEFSQIECSRPFYTYDYLAAQIDSNKELYYSERDNSIRLLGFPGSM